MANKYDELIYAPGYTSARDLGIISFELGVQVFGLGTEILFCPNLAVQCGIVDEGLSLIGRLLYFARSKLFLSHAKEGMILRIIPEDSYRRHLLVEGLHVRHLCVMFFFGKVCHILFTNGSLAIYNLWQHMRLQISLGLLRVVYQRKRLAVSLHSIAFRILCLGGYADSGGASSLSLVSEGCPDYGGFYNSSWVCFELGGRRRLLRRNRFSRSVIIYCFSE